MALSTITTTICDSPANAPNVASTSTGAIQKQQLTAKKQKHSVVQTGMDRYITINSNKRNRSPQNNKQGNQPKINKINIETVGDMGSNRYALLGESIENPNKEKCDSKTKSSKPPPIYIRDKSSNELVKNLTKLIGENTFHIIPLTKGNIHETKLQIYAEKDYRVVQAFLTKEKKNYYTYQLKSSKGQVVVLKGIEPTVKPEEIKEALHMKGFEAKVVINIINRNKIPQPLFKVELAPATKPQRKNELHPIYGLQYLLHRRIKLQNPVQCTNCQEFGHTKTYCTLTPVCVACGDLHNSADCPANKNDNTIKKFSNCGGNHTANYRGCPVFKELRSRFVQRLVVNSRAGRFIPTSSLDPSASAIIPNVSYAAAVQGIPQQKIPSTQLTKTNTIPISVDSLKSQDNNAQNGPIAPSSIEATLNAFLQQMSHQIAQMHNIFTQMCNMFSETMKTQSILIKKLIN